MTSHAQPRGRARARHDRCPIRSGWRCPSRRSREARDAAPRDRAGRGPRRSAAQRELLHRCRRAHGPRSTDRRPYGRDARRRAGPRPGRLGRTAVFFTAGCRPGPPVDTADRRLPKRGHLAARPQHDHVRRGLLAHRRCSRAPSGAAIVPSTASSTRSPRLSPPRWQARTTRGSRSRSKSCAQPSSSKRRSDRREDPRAPPTPSCPRIDAWPVRPAA